MSPKGWNKRPALAEDRVQFEFEKLWVNKGRVFQRFGSSNVRVYEEILGREISQGIEPPRAQDQGIRVGNMMRGIQEEVLVRAALLSNQ